jgi:outer membrane receptor protein involved in Fe transport
MDYDFKTNFARLVVALLLGLTATFAIAQGIVTGSISGIATDSSGALVSGAKITAKHLATNREYTTESTGNGLISLRSLPSGAYDVRVEAPGFRAYESKGVLVTVGADTSLGAIGLEIGASTETVTVEGAAPLIEATTDQVSQSFSSESVASLPIGNGFDSLTLFVAGVASAGDNNFTNANGAGFVANGQRSRSNNFQIDGQNNNDNSIAGPSIFFGNQDAIAEVQVVTNYSAEYGRNTGSVVNYITKSGTNQFHGTGFEFWAGNTFSSLTNEEKNPLLGNCAPGQDPATVGCTAPTVPQFVDNRFGGTVGGPIVKDHAWFFGSTNFERQRAGGSPSTSFPDLVPTANGVQQLIAAFPNSPAGPLLAAVGPAAITTQGNPTFNNVQPVLVTNQIDPTTGSAFDCGADPAAPGCTPIEFGSITRFVAAPVNDYEATGRVDIRLTSRDNFFARYVFQQQLFGGINFGNGVDVGDWQTIPGRSQQIGLDWVRNFSSSLVNQVRFSYSRARFFFEEGSVPSCNDQTPLECPPDFVMIGAAPQDRVSFGVTSGFPQGRLINVYQVQDNASKQIGRHTLKFGGEYDKQRSPNVFLPNNNGLYIFSSFSDIVADNPFQTRITVGDPKLPFHEKDVAAYFQDDWRVKDNLTLNLGVRWEWNQQAINLLHDRSVANQTGSNPIWPSVDPATGQPIPLSLATVPRVPEDYNNFGPVVGFAWTPRFGMFSPGKTVIRGGFRLSYDPSFYNIFLNVATSAPTVNAVTLAAPGPGTVPTSGFHGSDVLALLRPQLPPVNPGIRNQSTVGPNFHNPYSEQWNVGVQRELTSKAVMEIRYVGNRGVGLFQNVNGNPALQSLIDGGFQSQIPPGLTPCATPGAPGNNGAGYANCNFRRVVERTNTAWSKYNSLQSELRIGNWHGLTSTASYTWSHTLDNASEIFSTAAGGNTTSFSQSPFDTDRAERANSGIDFPNVFGLTVVYDLPFAKEQHGFLGHVLGGWQVNTTYRYTTGQPYTTIQDHASSLCDPTSTLSTSFDACRPIVSNPAAPLNTVGVCTDPTLPNCGIADFVTGAPTTLNAVHWIQNEDNAATFFGSPFLGVGRNTLRGDNISTANLAVFKNFKFGERISLQFQAQAFNVLNHMFRGTPDPVLDDVASFPFAGAPPAFQSTAYNFSGGGNNLEGGGSTNATFDGIGRRRLLFGLKIIF